VNLILVCVTVTTIIVIVFVTQKIKKVKKVHINKTYIPSKPIMIPKRLQVQEKNKDWLDYY
jgi:hypothetical protein